MTIKICLVCGKFKEKVTNGTCPACYMIIYRRDGKHKDLLYEGKCDNCGKIKKDIHRGLCQSCYKLEHKRVQQLLAPLIKCQCDPKCPIMIPNITMEGKPAKFAKGHSQKGKNNNMYKRGWFMKGNYKILTGYYDHPNASKKGEIPEHIIVMTEHLNRPLFKGEVVHHIDPVREGYCNNDISNLELSTRSLHQNIHNPKKGTGKDWTGTICIACGSDKTSFTKSGKPHWMKHPETKECYVCMKCYRRIKSQIQTTVPKRRSNNVDDRVCIKCGATKSETKSGKLTWHELGDGTSYECKKCYDKSTWPERRKKDKRYNGKRNNNKKIVGEIDNGFPI